MDVSTISGFQVLAVLCAFMCAYTASKLIYNLFLHPLRSIPGPLFARSTILCSQRQVLKGRLHIWLHEVHQEYGPVVRIAPNELSFLSGRAWKDIYSFKTNFPRDMTFYGPDIYGNPPGIVRADNFNHGRQRRLVSHDFSDKALREQETLLKGYATLLVRKLKEATLVKPQVNIVDWLNFTTLDMMADLTFGEPLKCLEGSSYTPWVASISGHIRLLYFSQLARHWPGLTTLLQTMIPAGIKEKRRLHMMHSVDRVKKRLERKTDRPDIWTYVLRYSNSAEKTEKGLTETEMNSTATFFMTAGTETTATTLSGLIYRVLRNPETLRRLVYETRSTFTSHEGITMTKLSQLEYLNACIEEGLRIYPPVPIGLPRLVPQGGAEIDGIWVPGGVTVQIPMYAAYHSLSHFKGPDSFDPERWLPEASEKYATDRKQVFNPFSYGPRNCVGKNLA